MSGPLIVGGKDFQTINPMIKTFAQMQGAMEIAALLAIILGLATSILLMIMQKIENPVLNVMAHGIAYIMFVIYMLPIIYVFMFSFTDARAIKTGKISIHSFTLKNYKYLFELDNVTLEFEEDALQKIAEKAVNQGTGARGLRAIVEGFISDIMYEIPSDDSIEKCIITGDVVLNNAKPTYIYNDERKQLRAGKKRKQKNNKEISAS